MKRFTMAFIMVLMLAIGGGAAQAQAPVGNGYNPNDVLEDVDRIPPSTAGQDDSGGGSNPNVTTTREQGADRGETAGTSLPFTGLDVGFLALGGIAMLGVGVGLRRLSRSTG